MYCYTNNSLFFEWKLVKMISLLQDKPHKCNLCSKSFPTPGDLRSHMYVHSGSWPFKCHICSRGFSKHTNLKNHLFLHTGKHHEFNWNFELFEFGPIEDCWTHKNKGVKAPDIRRAIQFVSLMNLLIILYIWFFK